MDLIHTAPHSCREMELHPFAVLYLKENRREIALFAKRVPMKMELATLQLITPSVALGLRGKLYGTIRQLILAKGTCREKLLSEWRKVFR